MHEALIKYFESYAVTPFVERDIELIKNIFVPKRFKKRQFFLQEGEVCKYGAFIVKGAMRQYTIDDKGDEHIVQLLIENWWANDRESNMRGTPSRYFIEAWEDTEALLITRDNMYNLIHHSPTVREWTEKLEEIHYIASQKRLNVAISLTARQRYYELEKTYPEFLQRFPQHIIASYLGISKDTLSRIRQQATKR
ncbi:MAG TPA: Crp/Fnr family transcriptional regulator [Puia sp.]|nr:Crp/Fnr family transcriptional regulator [Puia sp.]